MGYICIYTIENMKNPSTPITTKEFYDKKLKIIQRNAKKLQSHPVMANVQGIQDQLDFLRSSHRRFIFAILQEMYGEDKARIMIQSDTIKESIENFENLTPRSIQQLNGEQKIASVKKGLFMKMKHSFYYKDKSPAALKDELIDKAKDKIPDLVKLPKLRRAI